MTEAELRLIASAANIGESNKPIKLRQNPCSQWDAKSVVNERKTQVLFHVGYGRETER